MLPTDSGCDLPEAIVIWEIIGRLPPKAVLRCRAVCKSWRRLTSTREFVLAHHRNQPLLPIVHVHDDVLNSAEVPQDPKDTLLVPDLGDDILRPMIRYTPHSWFDFFTVHAACDGLLLISLNNTKALDWERRFYISNPATRQRALLRQLVGPISPGKIIRIAGLYPHHASGEYRVLYFTKSPESSAVYHVLTLGSDGDPRCIGRPAACESVEKKLAEGLPVDGLLHTAVQATVLLRGSLHWKLSHHGDIMVFDTVAETFWSMRRPSVGRLLLLFEMAGTLAMICSASTTMDLWLLQDYEARLWTFKHRIDMSRIDYPGWDNSVVVSGISYCDIKGKRLRIIRFGQYDMEFTPLTSHRLQVSLAPLTFFGMHESDDGDDPPFFEDLLNASVPPLRPLFKLL